MCLSVAFVSLGLLVLMRLSERFEEHVYDLEAQIWAARLDSLPGMWADFFFSWAPGYEPAAPYQRRQWV